MTGNNKHHDWTEVDRGWGHAVGDFATLSEPSNVREYLAMHEHLRVSAGDRVLDIACGSGLAVELVRLRGAQGAGIDASERLVAVARDRSPDADLRVGDMHALPWNDATFDAVTSFRGIWGTTPSALAEAFRVLRPGGRLGLTVWGHIKASPGAWALGPFRLAAAPKVENQAAMVALGRPSAGETLLEQYGFEAVRRVAVPFVWEFSDPETYARALASTGPAFEAIEEVGEEEFHRVAVEIASARVRAGLPLRAEIDVVGYLARKPVEVAADRPHFLQLPPETPEYEALRQIDEAETGFVMNASHLWGWQPDTVVEFFGLLGKITKDRLSFRERGLIVIATASTIGDSYCSISWATKLTPTVGADVAASVLRHDDSVLTPMEQAMTAWIRRVMRGTVTTAADIESLRAAGFDDERIFAMTTFAAMRLAFSTVNSALGAYPDWQFRNSADPEVLGAVGYGRPIGVVPAR